jgi:hypothetical protein
VDQQQQGVLGWKRQMEEQDHANCGCQQKTNKGAVLDN